MNTSDVLERFPATSNWNTDQETLPPAIDAQLRHVETWGAGRLAYYVDSRAGGRPVVLLHGVNAAASSREMAPLFDGLRGERHVYALDLPGFGLSERGDRWYDIDVFRGAVRRFLTDVVRTPDGADVIALSLSSEFAAAVACEEPSLVHSLVLVSPTGLGKKEPRPSGLLRTVSHMTFVSDALFRALATPASIRYFLRKSFVGEPDKGLVDYCLRTVKAPGAARAPLAFVAGDLFTQHAYEALYAPLPVPTLVVHDEDPNVGFERLDELTHRNSRVEAVRVAPTRGMPQFDQPGATLHVIRRFWMQNPW